MMISLFCDVSFISGSTFLRARASWTRTGWSAKTVVSRAPPNSICRHFSKTCDRSSCGACVRRVLSDASHTPAGTSGT